MIQCTEFGDFNTKNTDSMSQDTAESIRPISQGPPKWRSSLTTAVCEKVREHTWWSVVANKACITPIKRDKCSCRAAALCWRPRRLFQVQSKPIRMSPSCTFHGRASVIPEVTRLNDAWPLSLPSNSRSAAKMFERPDRTPLFLK
jgi:hypothetical protein